MTEPSILLVEDNPDDEMLARRAFRAESREQWVTVAHDGTEAIDRVTGAKRPPSLVLLDLNLPGTDGFAVLEAIRRNPATFATPVVVLTSSSDSHDIERAYALGANSFITKPIDFSRFIEVVRELSEYWLDLNRGGNGGAATTPA